MDAALRFAAENRQRFVDELLTFLRIPSISTDPAHRDDVRRGAEWTAAELRRIGCPGVEIMPTDGHPAVYGQWAGVPGNPTILIYGHYDVQPVDPLNLWESPPFEPAIRDGQVFARGAADDKGQVLIHLKAVEAHLKTTDRLPVNVKFLIEGEEEIGSPHLDPLVTRHADLLRADAVVISDSTMFARGLPSICYGIRGLVYFQVDLVGTRRDLHSGSYGGAVANPNNVLAGLSASLKDATGRVTIPGFYDRVRRLKPSERRAFRALPFDEEAFRKDLGAPALSGERGYGVLERLWVRPTLDINGIWGGFTGPGAKTVIPAGASAKISMRLVPDQDPDEIASLFEAHLRRIAPPTVDLAITRMAGGKPWVTPTAHPALRAAARALEQGFGRKPVFMREGGSIPVVATFADLFKIPCILVGFALPDNHAHAPNERLDLETFHGGILSAIHLYPALASALTARPA